MDATRKIIGVCIIVFFGLPILFGMTWAVGLIRAATSPEFVSDLPQKVITELPDTVDQFFRAAQDEGAISDPETRAWFKAAAAAGVSPKEILESTGIMTWARGELTGALKQVGMVLRGERRPAPIVLNLRPLKAALLSPEIDRFLKATMDHLPPCDEKGARAWAEVAGGSVCFDSLPACRPSTPEAGDAVLAARTESVRRMDDETVIFEGIRGYPGIPFRFSWSIPFISFFLFLIPAVFIFAGAFIADSSPRGFLLWSGGSTLAGGVPTLAIALAAKHFALWAIRDGALSWSVNAHRLNDLELLLFDKLKVIPEAVISRLLSPVIGAAVIVCVVGVVLLALSSTARGKAKPAPVPAASGPTAPPAPSAPPAPGA
jgi:hypothetical protein